MLRVFYEKLPAFCDPYKSICHSTNIKRLSRNKIGQKNIQGDFVGNQTAKPTKQGLETNVEELPHHNLVKK